jgi:hypothetical protein
VLIIYKACWHPVAALVASVLCFGLWTCGALFSPLLSASNEVPFHCGEEWYVEARWYAAIALAYLGMSTEVFVQWWHSKTKKNEKK